jgi:LysM repeat protein
MPGVASPVPDAGLLMRSPPDPAATVVRRRLQVAVCAAATVAATGMPAAHGQPTWDGWDGWDGREPSPRVLHLLPEDDRLLAGDAGPPGPSRPPPDARQRHIVARGESLAQIAAAFGRAEGDGWRLLYDANPHVDHPDVIEPGTQLRIPAPEEALARRELPPAAVTGSTGGGTGSRADAWDRLARCESGGNWAISSGNGFYGGLQFSLSSWREVGGTGYPHEHSRAVQIAMAERLLARRGWTAWPSCSRRLGLR